MLAFIACVFNSVIFNTKCSRVKYLKTTLFHFIWAFSRLLVSAQWQICRSMLAPSSGPLAPPPTVNTGSAPAFGVNNAQEPEFKNYLQYDRLKLKYIDFSEVRVF